ncbi:hypothetical protein M2326_003446, partial [Flavobacterium sp. 7A]|nr:hypothetical protein [Flavobacterium sp. 7A]
RELYEILTFKNFHYFYVFQYFKDMNLTAYLKIFKSLFQKNATVLFKKSILLAHRLFTIRSVLTL